MKRRRRALIKIKEKYMFLLFTCLAIALFLLIWNMYGKKPDVSAEAAIIIEAGSGEIIYGKNIDVPYPTASMSKMMTEYLVLEQIRLGSLKWDDTVTISRTAAQVGGASIPVKAGDQLSVRDLFIAMAVSSANNAAVSLAEHIAGSEPDFVRMMNDKAWQLGLTDSTRFVNATGLTNEATGEHTVMTAGDVAVLARRLVNDFPEIIEYSMIKDSRLEFQALPVSTTNGMLYSSNPSYQVKGLDGLKTGYTSAAGYCFAGTAKRGNKRLISVVMGSPSSDLRFVDTRNLLSYGYNDWPNLRYYTHRLYSRAKSFWAEYGL